jgi:excisionase family DNA binding protein
MRILRLRDGGGSVSAGALEPVRPGEPDVAAAVAALPQVRQYLARHPGDSPLRLRVDDDQGEEILTVPRAAVELLARVLAQMAAGHGVSVVPFHAELTTQQAADLLNVSRPFVIGLLNAGALEYRLVGTHRRIRAQAVLDYLRVDDQRRRQAADELTVLNQEMGLL